MIDESAGQNMLTTPQVSRAIGIDVSRHLPGLYWLNFFGQPYRDLLGRERLLAAPGCRTAEIDDGVLLELHEEPRAWHTDEYRQVQERVLDHLGRQHFFDRRHPDRETVAPDFSPWMPQRE